MPRATSTRPFSSDSRSPSARVRARLPERLRILGRWYTVDRAWGIWEGDQELDACVEMDKHLITIEATLQAQDAREALMHEIKHVINETLALDTNAEWGHRVASVVEDAVLADNPALVRLYKERRNA